jgi:gag-polypeptide of LTR copia-type
LLRCLQLRHTSGPIEPHIDKMRMDHQLLVEKGLILPEILQVANLMISLPRQFGNVMSSFIQVDEKELKFENVASAILTEQRRQSLSDGSARTDSVNTIERYDQPGIVKQSPNHFPVEDESDDNDPLSLYAAQYHKAFGASSERTDSKQ